ncbi:WD repeat-containing protein 93-like [Hydractinia symbiolongicarpus]|uniref:WD repeat-containing protein 93-like n=1 Tax=Hydractinia symbiolongicarpus TaxID=13093 RepID=UPI00254EDD7B|nr:WD repeat-containing protein 93-like [Hydractinia symbiolongicarpus]
MSVVKKPGFNRYEPISPSLLGDEWIEDTFLDNVDKLHDVLPQPFRRIDKLVWEIFEQAWICIEHNEKQRQYIQSTEVKLNKVIYEEELLLHDQFKCSVACDCYLFVGVKHQLIVYELPKLNKITSYNYIDDTNKEENFVEDIHVVTNADDIVVIVTKDYQGQVKIFGLKEDTIFLMQHIEVRAQQEKICAKMINLSEDNLYLAINWDDFSKQWLDVYKLPYEEWMNNMDNMETPTESPTADVGNDDENRNMHEDLQVSESAVKRSFTKVQHVLRVNPPLLKPCSSTSISAILKNVDIDSNVIGSGSHHLLTSTFFEHICSEFQYKSQIKEDIDITKRSNTIASVHFLKGQMTSSLFPSKNSQNADSSCNSILVWWKDSNQLYMYPLKASKDLEQAAFSILPNAHNIKLSSVNSQTDLIAVALVNNCISVWNRYVGQPLKVFMPADNQAVTMLCFSSVYHGNLQNRLTYATKHGKLVQMTCERNDVTNVLCLDDRTSSTGEGDQVVATSQGPMNLMTVIWKSGQVIIYNEASSQALCQLDLLSESNLKNAPHLAIVYTKEYILAIRDESDKEKACSRVFLFEPDEYPILQPFFHFHFLAEDEEDVEKVDNLEKNFLRFLRRRKLSDESLHARIATQKRELMMAR